MRHFATMIALMFLVVGCNKTENGLPKPPENPPEVKPAPSPGTKPNGYEEISVTNGGSLRVAVVYTGKVPTKKINPPDPYCAEAGAIDQDDLVVDPESKGLKDVVVYLDHIHKGKLWGCGSAVIDQEGCVFRPKVVLVPCGAPLLVKNSDETLHNFHSLSELNGEVNRGMSRKGAEFEYKLTTPEFIRVKCDVHPWMSAAIIVQKHPYYTLTMKDGVAEMGMIPPGKYTLKFWHLKLEEKLESETREIEIKPGEELKLNLSVSK